jgi:hypothetical protein
MNNQTYHKPAKLPIQIIGPTTLARARAEYRDIWNRDWPENDGYLAELVIDAKSEHDLPPTSKAKRDAVRDTTLEMMRLDHEFDPAN